jgi:preprotein translocase subunit YajC
MNFIRILADNTSNTQLITTLVMSVGLLALMYFFAIRPQKKKDREDAAMRNNLMVGDEVTTIGGIIGRVVSIKDETCVIETSKACTKIRILKTAIRSVDVPVSATKG